MPRKLLNRRISRVVTTGPLGLLRRCSRRVADHLFGARHSERAAPDVRLPYALYFFSAAEPVKARAAYSPLARRGRRLRRRD